MKPSTIPKYSSQNKHIKWKVITAVIVMWASLTIPLCFFEYAFIKNQFLEKERAERGFQEDVLTQTFEQYARYGDLINTKGHTEALGNAFGLQKILVCRDGNDIFGTVTNVSCPTNLQPHKLELFGERFDLYFLWTESIENFHTLIIATTITSSLLALFLFFAVGSTVYAILVKKINQLSQDIALVSSTEAAADLTAQLPELTPIVNSIYEMRVRIEDNNKALIHLKTTEALGMLAKQVAHDIRSPLSALKILSESDPNDNLERKNLIKNIISRIEGIANSLLNKSSDNNLSHLIEININTFLLNLISIKSAENAGKQIDIIFINSNAKRDVPIKIPISEDNLFRIISNVVNNGLESYSNPSTPNIIEIENLSTTNFLKLKIRDYGKGINADLLETIKTVGGSHGKEHLSNSGYGLGLSYIKAQLSKINGNLQIDSVEGKGTTVEILIPIL